MTYTTRHVAETPPRARAAATRARSTTMAPKKGTKTAAAAPVIVAHGEDDIIQVRGGAARADDAREDGIADGWAMGGGGGDGSVATTPPWTRARGSRDGARARRKGWGVTR